MSRKHLHAVVTKGCTRNSAKLEVSIMKKQPSQGNLLHAFPSLIPAGSTMMLGTELEFLDIYTTEVNKPAFFVLLIQG